MKIMDFGCANGILLDYLNTLGVEKKNLFGTDISEEMLAITRSKGYNTVTITNKQELSHQFDLITLWDVLEHVENPKKTIETVAKSLHKRGKLLIQTPRIGFLSDNYLELFEHYLPIEHVHLFPRETLVGLVELYGFKTIKVSSFGANVPGNKIPNPYKEIFDKLAKLTDQGITQLALFEKL